MATSGVVHLHAMPSAKTAPADGFTAARLREALAPEPLLSHKFHIRFSRQEWEAVQRLSAAAGATPAHVLRRLVAIAAAELEVAE